uniref:Uncharacterized protein n=1 Tax=Solanum tuberosum TaxID=4113 RepID=M1DK72_SOLTU
MEDISVHASIAMRGDLTLLFLLRFLAYKLHHYNKNARVEDEPNLELTLALRNGPLLSPSRNVPPLRQNEQAATSINLDLSLATRYVPAPRPIIDLAAGTNLEHSLEISNSTYGEQSSSSQIWPEDMMNIDDPNEEHDDETFHPNMKY